MPVIPSSTLATPRTTGTVKWFNDAKGYGFISPSIGGPDIFVHHSEIDMSGRRTLIENDPVSFELISVEKGLQARFVRRS